MASALPGDRQAGERLNSRDGLQIRSFALPALEERVTAELSPGRLPAEGRCPASSVCV